MKQNENKHVNKADGLVIAFRGNIWNTDSPLLHRQSHSHRQTFQVENFKRIAVFVLKTTSTARVTNKFGAFHKDRYTACVTVLVSSSSTLLGLIELHSIESCKPHILYHHLYKICQSLWNINYRKNCKTIVCWRNWLIHTFVLEFCSRKNASLMFTSARRTVRLSVSFTSFGINNLRLFGAQNGSGWCSFIVVSIEERSSVLWSK